MYTSLFIIKMVVQFNVATTFILIIIIIII